MDYDIGRCTIQFSIETSTTRDYGLVLRFDRDSKLIAFKHSHEDWHKKRYVNFDKEESLFSCYSENRCIRDVEFIKGEKTDCYNFCRSDEECERSIRNRTTDSCTLYKEEECQKSEIESKWGYKLW